MLATLRGAQTAITACQSRSKRAPFSSPAMCTYMFATAGAISIGTGVWTSVSLFPPMLFIVPLLLLGVLVVLISLLLTGLTGLIKLASLVGHEVELTTSTVWGD